MDVEIRAVGPHQHQAVGELLAAVYLADGLLGDGVSDQYLETLRDTAARAAEADVLVAVDPGDGGLLGTVTFAPAGTPYAEVARPDEGEFRMLAVAARARRRGVGEALVLACADRARTLDLRGLALSTQSHLDAAPALYRRLGFVRDPERDWSPNGIVSLRVYRLELD